MRRARGRSVTQSNLRHPLHERRALCILDGRIEPLLQASPNSETKAVGKAAGRDHRAREQADPPEFALCQNAVDQRRSQTAQRANAER